jgi:signal transduction histidine kinase
MHGRGREYGVIAAGLVAGAMLVGAGLSVHGGLRSAGDVAVARLAGEVADAVVDEWGRLLREREPPAPFRGEGFRWSADEPLLRPVEPLATAPDASASSVFATLLSEAERRELVAQDPASALDLVEEALDQAQAEGERALGHLRALQLLVHLDRLEDARAHWEPLRSAPLELVGPALEGGLPLRVLGWLALPPALQAEPPIAEVLPPEDLERLALAHDRLELRPDELAHFELAPLVVSLCERARLAPPPLERRTVAALARVAALPEAAEGRWELVALAGQPFLARREGSAIEGGFCSLADLARSLAARAHVPAGFTLDFDGTQAELGPTVRAPVTLAGAPFAFTLRHADPTSIAREQSARLGLLRTALVVLGALFAAGGIALARVLARQRKLDELKSAFIAGVSHDLRTPLAALLLVAENLESGVAGEAERVRYHRALRKETARLRRVIDDVLDFARLERGEVLRLACEEVALEPFLEGLCEDLCARVAAAERAFTSRCAGLPAEAVFDAHGVRRALENLVDNALKHGVGRIELACVSDGARLRFTVSDEGPGIPPRERERVFEPFERLNGRTHVGGTGLGLAIVRAVARGHGGDARVLGDKGNAFELELPLAEVRS